RRAACAPLFPYTTLFRSGCAPGAVAPCATGRIGVQVERARLLRGVRAAVAALSAAGLPAAAHAITTTDAFPKTAVRRSRRQPGGDRKSTRLNSSHDQISY